MSQNGASQLSDSFTNGVINIANDDIQPSRPALREICGELHRKVQTFLQKEYDSAIDSELVRRVQEQTRTSLEVIREALQTYDSIPAIYAYPPDPFPLVTAFVHASSDFYHLDVAHIPTNPHPPPAPLNNTTTTHETSSSQPPSSPQKRITIRDAFATYLSIHPRIKAIFVGTRRTDPHGGKLTHFDPTDRGWPSFMRVHPVVDWKLAEIWMFLRASGVLEEGVTAVRGERGGGKDTGSYAGGYCGLYDEGYTSLGGRGDTKRNPLLKIEGEEEKYKPAYELGEDGGERLGRE
ncbi:MAG: hypothetical protein Q9227_006780 [Pyrenula ochraceoflavens]